ncbi:MAG: FadR/GntR family transcriptional regulator [Thermodesulfobacteriota bacterium]
MEPSEFLLVKPNRVSHQVAEQIRNLILEGKLKPGDKLPSERELSKVIGVGRLSLREGLRILESSGILKTRYGVQSGTYVAKVGLEHLTERFSDMLKLSDFSIDQLTEARLEIALINLRYFMKRGSKEEIQELETCLQEIERLLGSGLQTREQNLLFHQLIARGSKNPVFISLHNALLDILRQFLSQFSSPPEHSKKILEGKKTILKCIKEKDVEKALAAMEKLIRYTGNRIKSLIGKKEKTQ